MLELLPPQGIVATGLAPGATVLTSGYYTTPEFQIGLTGSGGHNFAIGIPNSLSATDVTQIGTPGSATTVAGIEATVLGIAWEDHWWGVALDEDANLGVFGGVYAADVIQAGYLLAPYAQMGVNIVGTIPSQIMTWWDNGQNYGAGLVENNNQVGLLLVNKGSSAYNGLNASSYTVPLFAETNGAVYTQALMNTAIGTNAGWAARNTLDDGSGNMVLAGHLTTGGSDGASNYVSSDFFWFQAQTSTIPSGAQGIYFNGSVQFTSGGTFAGYVAASGLDLVGAGNTQAGLQWSWTLQANKLDVAPNGSGGTTFTYAHSYPSSMPSGWGITPGNTLDFGGSGTMYFVAANNPSNTSCTYYQSNSSSEYCHVIITINTT